jgi:hypothetical protein
MAIYKCPVCESDIEVPDNERKGTRITCHICFAQLALHEHKKKRFLACAVCKEPVFDPANCGECERRRDKKRILKEGQL